MIKMLLLSVSMFVLAACASTSTHYENLRTDHETTDNKDAFYRKTKSRNYSVFFTYNIETGKIKLNNLITRRPSISYLKKMYEKNIDTLDIDKVISDCISVTYYNDTPEYSACYENRNIRLLSLFQKNADTMSTVGLGGVMTNSFLKSNYLRPGETESAHRKVIPLDTNRDAIDRFGYAINILLGNEVLSSCKVTDLEIAGYYRGGCKNGLAEGYGTAVGRDKYFGDFVAGNMKGKGNYHWVNGDSYEGDWSENKMHGNGTLTWNNGDKYTGPFVNDVRSGENGEFKDKSGKTSKGFFLNNKLLSGSEYAEYKCKIDTEFCKGYRLEQYRSEYNSAKTPKHFEAFIKKYTGNDPEKLVPQAKTKRLAALRQEIRDELDKAKSSADYSDFISAHKAYDPDKLIPKASTMRNAALKREKAEYDSVANRNWGGDYKVKITYETPPGKALKLLDEVKAAVRVRDPMGIWNPYWVPNFHAAAAYDNKGIIIGEWYTGYYDGWNDWARNMKPILSKLGVGYNIEPLGNTVSPSYSSSNYSSPSSSSNCSSGEKCFEITETKWDESRYTEYYIKCTKGYRVGQKGCISYWKQTGKWASGCGIGDYHTYDSSIKAGNYRCTP